MNPSQALRARLLTAATREKTPTRRAVRIRWAIFVAVMLGTWAVATRELGIHEGQRPLSLMVALTLGWAIVAAISTWIGWSSNQVSGFPRVVLIAVIFGAPLALSLLSLVPLMAARWGATGWASALPLPAHYSWHGEACRDIVLGLAGIPLLTGIVLRRGTDPIHPRLKGAAIGTASASCAGLTMGLSCPVVFTPHLLLGHVLPLLGAALLGALLGGIFLDLQKS
jgi:hypothetical protein